MHIRILVKQLFFCQPFIYFVIPPDAQKKGAPTKTAPFSCRIFRLPFFRFDNHIDSPIDGPPIGGGVGCQGTG